jgi:hypothetical protein
MKSIQVAHEDKWYANLHLRCDDKDYVRRVMTVLMKNHLAKDGWRSGRWWSKRKDAVDERDKE